MYPLNYNEFLKQWNQFWAGPSFPVHVPPAGDEKLSSYSVENKDVHDSIDSATDDTVEEVYDDSDDGDFDDDDDAYYIDPSAKYRVVEKTTDMLAAEIQDIRKHIEDLDHQMDVMAERRIEDKELADSLAEELDEMLKSGNSLEDQWKAPPCEER